MRNSVDAQSRRMAARALPEACWRRTWLLHCSGKSTSMACFNRVLQADTLRTHQIRYGLQQCIHMS